MTKRDYNKKGFTLVEMMVAIAVFSIVMVVAASALLNVIDANRKAQAIQIAINNINFALEGISKDMRMGTDYNCLTINDYDGDCEEGGTGIKYRSIRAYTESNGVQGFAYYRLNEETKQIESCLEKTAQSDCNPSNGAGFFPITSQDLEIKNFKFYVLNTDPDDGLQPRAVITLSGTAGVRENIKTSFDLQTSVSQRSRNSN